MTYTSGNASLDLRFSAELLVNGVLDHPGNNVIKESVANLASIVKDKPNADLLLDKLLVGDDLAYNELVNLVTAGLQEACFGFNVMYA